MKRFQKLALVCILTWGFFRASPLVFAQIVIPSPVPVSVDLTVSQKKIATTEGYILPFPGMLPDDRLYFLKILRDAIMETCIMDPLHKADFFILQADKHLSMGVALSNKNSWVPAATIIFQGKNFARRAVYSLIAFKSAGKAVPLYMVDKLTRSLDKHEELLTLLTAQSPEAQKEEFRSVLAGIQALQAEIKTLK